MGSSKQPDLEIAVIKFGITATEVEITATEVEITAAEAEIAAIEVESVATVVEAITGIAAMNVRVVSTAPQDTIATPSIVPVTNTAPLPSIVVESIVPRLNGEIALIIPLVTMLLNRLRHSRPLSVHRFTGEFDSFSQEEKNMISCQQETHLERMTTAHATMQAREAEAARNPDAGQRASLLAQAQAQWQGVKKQCKLEEEALHTSIALARDQDATRRMAEAQRTHEATMRDMTQRHELEMLKITTNIERLRAGIQLQSEAQSRGTVPDVVRQVINPPSTASIPTRPRSRTALLSAASQALQEAQQRFNRVSTNAQQTNDATLRDLPSEPRNPGDQATFDAYTARQIYAQVEFAALATDLGKIANAVGGTSCSDDELANVPARVKELIDDCLRRWTKFCDEVAAVAWVTPGQGVVAHAVTIMVNDQWTTDAQAKWQTFVDMANANSRVVEDPASRTGQSGERDI
ncbi:hypothetical protein MMC17_005649 [Xylographa soralifera]|nr:hypothetical protein [Xylographa soralifera]